MDDLITPGGRTNEQEIPQGLNLSGDNGTSSKMLGKLGLSRNPYVDRTAEKTMLRSQAFYLHSDLQGFQPSETTYIFFGKRGSGKTTIRLMMMQSYAEYNEKRKHDKKGPIFVVDLCRPGHMDECLKAFMKTIGADKDNWDANFSETWSSNDLADCIVSFAINDMMRRVVTGTEEGEMILNSLSNNPRGATQFLILSHLYTREDSATLNALRKKLFPIAFSSWNILKNILGICAFGGALAATGLGAYSLYNQQQSSTTTTENNNNDSSLFKGLLPVRITQTHLGVTALGGAGLLGSLFASRRARSSQLARAEELCKPVRCSQARPELVAPLLNSLFLPDDTADRIRGLHIGHSAQQKLELMDTLCKACGFEGLAVFGDCFDEVGLLDPLLYPGALKIFAREVCKNEVLNQGRLHFFFPDARASLDLSTDRIVREARFDRHFVRDLTWSRFQLEDLAERRFNAAQRNKSSAVAKFQDLFEHVSKEDFSGAISKLTTPRELMVFMTELLARVEANSEEKGAIVAAQDMEIAVKKAQEQSV